MRRRLAIGLALLWTARALAADVSASSQHVVDIANGAVLSTAISVTTSATTLPSTALAGRRRVVLANVDPGVTVYLGACSGTTVTTSNGFPLVAGMVLPMELGPDAVVCGIVASGTVAVRVLEER